jgi:hypothetical protein
MPHAVSAIIVETDARTAAVLRNPNITSGASRRDLRGLLLRVLAALTIALFPALAPAAPGDRVALLIGNNAYPASALRSAVNDVRDLAATLRDLGFKTTVRENATRKDMIDAIRQFGQAIEGAETALFFFSGHAMQYKERNYLIPVDAQMGSEDDVTFFSVEVAQVFDRMDRARTRFNLLILDACRNNPFEGSFKLSSAGLAQMSAPSGTLIAYATAPGAVAADGFGRNGIYTKHILQNIAVPDLPVEIMFKRVREGVERETHLRQTPWDASSLKGDFVFNTSTRTSAAASSGPSADMQLQIEREFWISVRDSVRVEDVEAYLAKYPNGHFATLAKNRLDALLRPARTTEPRPRVAPAPPGSAPNAPASPAGEAPGPIAHAAPPSATGSGDPAVALAAGARDTAVERSVAPQTVNVASVPAQSAAAPRPANGASRGEVGVAAVPTVPSAATMATTQSGKAGREIAPGVIELVFDDGTIYRGGLRGNAMHGTGEYVSKTFRYKGEFEDGRRHGKGSYAWANHDVYEGGFANDVPHGTGSYRFASGERYEGEFKAGAIAGRGIYVSARGDQFEGTFVDGRPEGVGLFRFANGDRYEGQVAAGKPNGKGRYFSSTGARIEAPFVDGKPEGKGTCQFANGDRYEGDFRAGALTGTGAYFYSGGVTYQGDVVDGTPRGRGTFHFADGSRFEGTFEEGISRAKGVLVRADGTSAAAEMVDGQTRVAN